MLSQIVRPMVQTQVRLLANSRATRSTLVATISQWLGFLGVRAQVTQLESQAGKISLMLVVDKPDVCDVRDWQQIIENIGCGTTEGGCAAIEAQFTPRQQGLLHRLLACLIQAGCDAQQVDWDELQPQLRSIGLDEATLLGIRSALKVPQCLEDLLEDLDPDVAAVALPKAVSIAALDRQVTSSEDEALKALLQAMKHSVT
jgi:hypothetical protein